jgi:transcriptional regulator with XRE-family HTH domain
MPSSDAALEQTNRRKLADSVRVLRRERHWTQAELAGRLHLSQSRLSEIERGGGSFTAEQFLTILKLFNVPVSRFVGGVRDRDADLQNALARIGASQLRESSDVLPSEALDQAQRALREAIVQGTPRFITALAPVLVHNIDRLNLTKLHLDLADAGLERRLAWVAENTLDAIRKELADSPDRAWAQRLRRADLVLDVFLESPAVARSAQSGASLGIDILDTTIRSRQTLEEVRASSSSISKKWGIVTQLQPEDFLQALRAGQRARHEGQ